MNWPEVIDKSDKQWWLRKDEKEICDYYLGECKMEQRCAMEKVRGPYKNTNTVDAAASRFFKMPKVERYLALRSKQLTRDLELTQEEIIKDLMEVRDMAMGRKPSHVYATDKDGNIFPDFVKVVNLPVAKQTLEQLGKYHKLAMWTEKTEREVNVVNFNFNMEAKKADPKVINEIPGMSLNLEGGDK